MTFISAIQFDETSLYVASKRGHSKIVKELLKANANIDLANEVICLIYNCTGLLINCPLIIIVFLLQQIPWCLFHVTLNLS